MVECVSEEYKVTGSNPVDFTKYMVFQALR